MQGVCGVAAVCMLMRVGKNAGGERGSCWWKDTMSGTENITRELHVQFHLCREVLRLCTSHWSMPLAGRLWLVWWTGLQAVHKLFAAAGRMGCCVCLQLAGSVLAMAVVVVTVRATANWTDSYTGNMAHGYFGIILVIVWTGPKASLAAWAVTHFKVAVLHVGHCVQDHNLSSGNCNRLHLAPRRSGHDRLYGLLMWAC